MPHSTVPDQGVPASIDAETGNEELESLATCSSIDAEWCELRRNELSLHALQTFYARHKYLIMARHIDTYKALGRLLAQRTDGSIEALAEQMIALIMAALQRPATRAGHTNVLQHIRGYLKHDLNQTENSELNELIEHYRCGRVPLQAPLTLLREHFARHPHPYIGQQSYLYPYPEALQRDRR